ncbi:MAG: ABC transporter permease subunit [Microbacteriaceae bacterium]|nr:ABC transporter permease subunit [Microbacteriaceae bacterium]MCI1206731.1 ABC transporter permease subunit [Microbacteriaceae bacterium]
MTTVAKTRRRGFPKWASSTIGIVAIIAVWWGVAILFQLRSPKYAPIPTPVQVLQALFAESPDWYWRMFSVTLGEAGVGFLWGNAIALLLAFLVLIIPALDGVIMQIAVVSYCLPIVAIGPIALIVLGGATSPGDLSGTAVFLAALSVIFTTVVGSLLGLKAADRSALDVVSVYGGGRLAQLLKVRLVAAVPEIFSALQMSVPAAFLGAVLGEYFGKIEQAVGPALVAAQVQLNSGLVWALFLLCALIALVGYWLMGLIGRLVAPWSKGDRR